MFALLSDQRGRAVTKELADVVEFSGILGLDQDSVVDHLDAPLISITLNEIFEMAAILETERSLPR